MFLTGCPIWRDYAGNYGVSSSDPFKSIMRRSSAFGRGCVKAAAHPIAFHNQAWSGVRSGRWHGSAKRWEFPDQAFTPGSIVLRANTPAMISSCWTRSRRASSPATALMVLTGLARCAGRGVILWPPSYRAADALECAQGQAKTAWLAKGCR